MLQALVASPFNYSAIFSPYLFNKQGKSLLQKIGTLQTTINYRMDLKSVLNYRYCTINLITQKDNFLTKLYYAQWGCTALANTCGAGGQPIPINLSDAVYL